MKWHESRLEKPRGIGFVVVCANRRGPYELALIDKVVWAHNEKVDYWLTSYPFWAYVYEKEFDHEGFERI